MVSVFANFGKLSGRIRFSLIWNALFMLYSAVFAVWLHSTLQIVFTVFFGLFFVLAYKLAQRELSVHPEYVKTNDR
jgi:hypothetical protein